MNPNNEKTSIYDLFGKIFNKQMDEPKYNIKNIGEYLSRNEKLGEESFELIHKIKELEILYEKNKKHLTEMKRQELDRIAKEFLLNDYERRYNVSHKVVVSAIAGEDNSTIELIRHSREQKVK